MEILVGGSDVNPNELSGDGKPILRHAPTAGHEGVVKVPLGRGGVDPSEPDNRG